MNSKDHTDNDPIILMELLKILNANKDSKWITIPELTYLVNQAFNRGEISSPIVYLWDVVNKHQIRNKFIPELQQKTDIQVNHGVIVSSIRGIMMTNDIEVINRFIIVEMSRIKGISTKLMIFKEAKRRLQQKKLYAYDYPNMKLKMTGTPVKDNQLSFEDDVKEHFLNTYWDETWNGDDDYTEEKEQLWEFNEELRKEWLDDFRKKI